MNNKIFKMSAYISFLSKSLKVSLVWAMLLSLGFNANAQDCTAYTPTDICLEGDETFTITPPVVLTNGVWTDGAGTVLGNGTSLVVSAPGTYLYSGDNPNTGCPVNTCCPIEFVGVNCMDLALTKILDPNQPVPVYAGDDVTFNIEVFNQGSVDAYNIDITDYIPAGFVLNDTDWSPGPNNTALFMIAGPITPGNSTVVPITLTVTPSATAGNLTNTAEISDFEDVNGDHPPDTDSTPDDDPNNDGPADDNTTDGSNGDEDDSDPATVPVAVFDLALTKALSPSQPTPVTIGDDVTYVIEVCNQGTIDALNVEVVDYLPSGMVLNDPAWSLGSLNQAYITLPGPITPGNCTQVNITVTITSIPPSGTYENVAEISSAEDPDGNNPPDIDSTPDDDNGNDGPHDDGTTDGSNGDEDDADPAIISVIVPECNAFNDGPACFDGGVMLSESGGTAVSWSWTGPNGFSSTDQSPVVFPAAPGIYVVTITDANGLSSECETEVVVLPELTLDGVVTDALCEGSADGSVDITVQGGTSPYTFDWSNDGSDPFIKGATGAVYTLGNDFPHVYSYNVTYASLTDNSIGTGTMGENFLSAQETNGQIYLEADFGCPVNVESLFIGGGNLDPWNFDLQVYTNLSYTLEYSTDGTTWTDSGLVFTGPDGNFIQQEVLPAPIVAQFWRMSSTDANNGWWTTSEFRLEGAPIAGPTADSDPEDLSGEGAGTYTVLVTDANGCMITGSFTIEEPTAVSCSVAGLVDLSCFEAMDGELTATGAGGTAPYDYSVNGGAWQPGGTFTGLMAGTHTVTLRDANGCESTCDATLNEPALLSCTTTSTDETDCLVDDGTITVTATGGTAPLTYSLNGAAGQASGSFTGLGAGSYVITVTDAQGCETECEATLTTPEAPVCEITASADVTCNGGANGELTALGTGGNAPLEYSIDGASFQSSGTFTGLTAGVYTVTVRNQGNTMCTSTCSVTIAEPAALECSATGENLSCNAAADGSIDASAIGGSGSFEYSIDGTTFQLSNNFAGLAAGTYTVTTRDANDPNCSTSCDVTITEPAVLSCSLTGTMVSCNAGDDGTVTAAAIGGTAPLSYSLNGGPFQPGATFNGLMAGTHTVSITDDNGCMTSCSFVVTEPAPLACTASATDSTDCFADDGTVTGAAVGGTAPYEYSLDGGAPQAGDTFTNLGPGTYTITITDALGCTTDCEATVVAPDAPTCEIIQSVDVSCNGGSDARLEASGADGSGSYEYSLNGGAFQASGIFSGLPAGVYTVTVRNEDSPACTSTCSVTITEPEELTCEVVGTPESCYLTDGTLTTSALGGTLPYEYSLDGAFYQASNVFTGLTPGNYTVYTRDANGCETNCSYEILPDCFDMALTKMLAPGQPDPVAPGDLVTFNIEVCNQGTIDAFNIEVVDYTPSGMIMADASWTVGSNPNEVFQTIGGPMAPGACMTLPITMQVDPAYAGGSLQNFAEISEADDDTDPNNGGGDDWDSDPDNDPDNDGNYTDDVTDDTNGDEDDHDPAEVTVEFFDLALDKSISPTQAMPITPGDDITFDIEICNQGTIDGYNIMLSDTYPAFCTLSAADTNGWVDQGDGTAGLTHAGPVLVGECQTVQIVLTLDQAATPGDFSNVVEIDRAQDENGDQQDDIDSDGGNDDGDQSEDDEDDAPFTIEVFDLALLKVLSPNQPMPIQPGDDVTFVITVFNQGTMDAYNTVITDYIPAGLTLNDPNWVPAAGNSATYLLAGPLTAGTSQDISITVTVSPNFSGGATNVAEISDSEDEDGNHPQDEDSTPDSDPNNDNEEDGVTDGTNGDEDDSDPASIVVDVFDLALTKMLSPTQVVPVTLGDDVTYDIEVCNQGTIDAYNVEVVDYMPAGLTLNDANWTLGASNQAYITLAGPIAAGTCQTVQITCTITAMPTAGGYQNFAEISEAEDEDGNPQDDVDSTPDDDNSNDGPYDDDTTDGSNGDEDDHDPAYIPVELFDLALDKELSPNQVLPIRPGDDITFDIEICNEGTVDGYNVQLTDHYPMSTTLSVNDTNGWTDNGANATMTFAGPVLVGTCQTVQIVLTLDPAAGPGDFTNVVEIDGAEDEDGNPQDDIDSDGGNDDGDQSEDDEDDAPFSVETFDLALLKVLSPNQPMPIQPGDDVTFVITVINQGTMDAYNTVITDYIPAGLTLNDPTWVPAANNSATYVLAGPLTAGTSQDISITVTVSPNFSGGATNVAEISDSEDENGNHPEDEDSTPDDDPNNDNEEDGVTDGTNGDEDDSDPASIVVDVFDLALTKMLSPTQVVPVTLGDDVTYDIEVCNQGTIDAYNVEVVDYMPAGLTLNDANWSLGAGNQAYITIAGPITAGACQTVQITCTITTMPTTGGYQNFAEISEAEDENGDPQDDIDSEADDDNSNDGPYNDDSTDGSNGDEDDHDPAYIPVELFDLALDKELSPNQPLPIRPGDDITFDIEICNQGTVDGYNVQLTDHYPMSTTLSANDTNGWTDNGANATMTYAGPVLVGACQTVQIVLTLDPAAAPGDFTNVVEIDGAEDEDGNPQDDIDSDGGNDDGDQSEDDEDDAPFTVETFDLALEKTLDPNQQTPVYPGDNVVFFIEVFNQGSMDAYNVEITDYIPAGFTLNDPNWSPTPSGNAVQTIPGPIAAGSSTFISITLTVDPSISGTNATNTAEISDAEDEDGNHPADEDSTPDDDPNNDPEEDGVTDNSNGDEDDSDPADVPIAEFDLALTKQVIPSQPLPVTLGDDVTYVISVFNQGNVDAYNVQVADYLPACMSLNDSNWFLSNNGTAYTTLPGPIVAGTSQTVLITLTIDCAPPSGTFDNTAEISEAEDENGNNPPDSDSTPDDNPNNDGPADDDSTDGSNGDEDDSDPASIPFQIFDLALSKELSASQPLPITPGDDITFEIEVCNEGTVDGYNVGLVDHLPTSTNLSANDTNGWVQSGTDATLTIPGPIAVGQCETVEIVITLDANAAPGSFENVVEIDGAEDENGNPQDDIDSDDGNDDGDQSEDDEDSAPFEIETFDLALMKILDPAQQTPVYPGDDVEYIIAVENQGTITAYNVDVIDYIPAGFVLNDPNWQSIGSNAIYTINGPLAPGSTELISITLTVDNSVQAGNTTNYAEITDAEDEDGNHPNDEDSTPDANDGNDGPSEDNDTNNTNGDEDDHDPAEVPVAIFDLALEKTLAPGQNPVVTVGDDVTYHIEVFNQGSVDAYQVDIVDYIPMGMSLNDATWTSGTSNQAYYTIPGPIAAGGSVIVPIVVHIDLLPASGIFENFAEISDAEDANGNHPEDSDSTPDDDPNNDGPVTDGDTSGAGNGEDEDDHDPAVVGVQVFDLALLKELDPNQPMPIYPGDDVNFVITLLNQGTVDGYNVGLVDYIPAGMTLSANDTNGWVPGATAGTAEMTYSGPLTAGTSTTVEILLTLDPNAGAGDYNNVAEITGAEDGNGNPQTDIDSTPDSDPSNDNEEDGVSDGTNGDEDDSDPAPFSVEVFDLALTKVLSPSQMVPVYAGDDVTFLIEVFNQGTVPAMNVEVTDYLPAGFSLNDINWTDLGTTATRSVAGPINPGASTVLSITLTFDGTTSGTAQNVAEISDAQDPDGNTPDDVDSTADNDPSNDGPADDNTTDGSNGDEDDSDPASVLTGTFDLALEKTVSASTVMPLGLGSDITYDIEIINQGTVDAYNVEVVDYLPVGMSLNDANWSASANGSAYTTVAGPIPAGSSTIITITATIDAYPSGGGFTNTAEISSAEDANGNQPEDVDSTPDDNPNNEGPVSDGTTDGSNGDEDDSDPAFVPFGEPVFDLAILKTVSASTVTPVALGDNVTYDIEVINQGAADAYNVQVVDYLPAGMSLNDANWAMGGSSAYTTIAGPIAAGTSQIVTITLTIDAYPANGSSYDNTAEIADAEDQYGNHPTDIDSTPDDTNGNDGPVTDGVTDGTNGDEDDSDPASLPISEPIFDLALLKTVSPLTVTPVNIGDDVIYDIEVINQGQVDAYNVQVADYLPAGMTLNDANWTLGGSTAYTTIAGPIAAGTSTTVSITLTITDYPASGGFENTAEISSAEDENGNPATDIDSTPDDTNGNDGPVSDGVTDGSNGDEDDSDPAFLPMGEPMHDLALIKTLAPGQSANVTIGDDVDYTITVINQGTDPVYNVEVVDMIPTGFLLNDPTWTLSFNGQAYQTIPGPIAPGTTATVGITMTITQDALGGDMTNVAEISGAEDAQGNQIDDVDSSMDDNQNNDGPFVDNAINGENGDEDDSDPAVVNVGIFDLALMKTLASGQSPEVHAGDTATFTITVVNQGNIPAYNVTIVDYFPVGLVPVDPNWINTGSHASTVYGGPLAPGQSFQVDIDLEVTTDISGPVVNTAEIALATDENGNVHEDVDSDADATYGNDGTTSDNELFNAYGDEDDEDIAGLYIADDDDHTGCGCEIECQVSILNYTISECDPNGNGNAEFYIDFGCQWSNASDMFILTDNFGSIYGPYPYGDVFQVGPFNGDGESYVFTLYDSENNGCTAVSPMITAPDCNEDVPCSLAFQSYTVSECNDDGEFVVNFGYEWQQAGTTFVVYDNLGTSYGPFNYGDPISVGPYQGDGASQYQFSIHDVTNPDCTDVSAMITAPLCEEDEIGEVDACDQFHASAFIDCEGGEYYVVITLFGAPETTNGYSITSTHPGGFSGVISESFTDGPFPSGTGFGYTIALTSVPECAIPLTQSLVECATTEIDLLYFDGEVLEEGNFLKWSTATEVDNDYFILSRSLNGSTGWEAIANVDAAGNSTTINHYSELDVKAPDGISYYRLETVEFDGTRKLASQVISLERVREEFEFLDVYPVPTTSIVNAEFNSVVDKGTFTYRVFDAQGKVVFTKQQEVELGVNLIQVDMTYFTAGAYFLSISNGDQMINTRIIKK